MPTETVWDRGGDSQRVPLLSDDDRSDARRGARRAIIFGALIGAAILTLGILAVVTVDVSESDEIATLQEVREAGVLFDSEEKLFLVWREGEEPLALDARSPHLGELLVFCESSQWFQSHAHGEKFDRLGLYKLGPAPYGMNRFDVTVKGDRVFVHKSRVTEGPPRGTPGQQNPEGPFCVPPELESNAAAHPAILAPWQTPRRP